jgi:hypothetical protein
MAKVTKQAIYARYGIEFKRSGSGEYILAPFYGWIPPVLINGNDKLGKTVWTFSILPTNKAFAVLVNGEQLEVTGSCPCHCDGCYATKGNYRYSSTIDSLAKKTFLARVYLEWLERAIMAQIEADKIHILRIHAAGDFFSLEYIDMWKRVCVAFPGVVFWTYTKFPPAEKAFDDISNCNMVPSVIKGHGFNFGHIDYIMEVYQALKAANEQVYICRCGIDKNQHCSDCKGCSANKYVLFVEHSTDYKAEKDPLYPAIVQLIENQESMKTAF